MPKRNLSWRFRPLGAVVPALVLGLGCAAGTAGAQPTAAVGAQKAALGGANTPGALGARLATQGAPAQGVPACATCHGAQGEGMAGSGFPRLAGQSAAYLGRQIESFQQDTRSHPVMSPIAKAMTAEQNRAAAAYYAGLGTAAAGAAPAPAGQPAAPASAAPVGGAEQRGLRLAQVGDDAGQVQACANCHGPGGAGEPPAYPYLAGQHADYLTSALGQWKSGSRKNDPSGQMPAIAARLADADIAAVAAYYASQPAPAPGAQPSPAMPVRKTPVGRGGPPAVQPSQGRGTEQGAPLTGGSQGPGGGGGTTGVNPAPGGDASPGGRRP